MAESADKKRSNAELDAELQIGSEPYKQALLAAGGGGIDLPSVVAVHKLNLQRLHKNEHPKVFRDLALTFWLLDKKGMARTYARKYHKQDPEPGDESGGEDDAA
jgi:hypothetical protein